MVSEPPEGCTNGFMAPGSELVPFWMETNMNVWLYFWLYYGYINGYIMVILWLYHM